MSPIIDIQNLTFSYYSEEGVAPIVLDDLSLQVEEGSFVAVLGQNGSGKSTLAKHLNAILLPNRGTVTVDGIDTSDEDRLLDLRRTVGMVFQNPDNQIVASVVEEDVAFAPENMGLPPAEIRERVDRALELVHMTDYAHHAPHLLSGGQKQRVAIAGVIAMRPKVLVLDEATAMLDPEGRKDVMDIVKDLNQRVGVTVILITHHMEEAAEADRVLVLSEGRIAADGPPRQVFQQVEKLRSLGLSSPEPMELMWELRQAGLDVPLDVLTDDECVQVLQAVLAGSR